MSQARFVVGDVLDVLRAMPDASVDLVLSSPPFLALRSYLPAEHPDKAKEIGSEATPGEFIDVLLDVTEECRRVLAPHGSLCFELGDTYAGSGGAGGDYGPDGMRGGQQKFNGSALADRKNKVLRADGNRLQQGPGWPLDKSLCGIPELYRLSLMYGRNLLTGRETERWRVRNVVRWCRPNPPVGALCVDDQTEALTLDGWKRHGQLNDGDLIAAYDPKTDACRFLPAKFVRYEREGEPMVVIDKKATSQVLTEDHRVWTRTRKQAPHVRLARDLTNDCDTLLCAPFDDVPGPAPITTERAALLGWFIAEGTSHHRQARIVQSQTANAWKVDRIRELLRADGADFRETSYLHTGGSTIVTFHVKGELAEWLNLHAKRLPMAYVTIWPEAQAQALFDALIDGDGHRRKNAEGVLFHQQDEAIADAVQVLAIRLGFRASKHYQPSLRLWQITMSKAQVKDRRWTRIRKWQGEGIRRECYTGTVWCPMVETSFWLARRNGQTFITGNSDKFRPATSEMVVACTSRQRYFDLDAVRQPHANEADAMRPRRVVKGSSRTDGWGRPVERRSDRSNATGAPPLDWWEIPTEPYKGSHYATWPSSLLVKPILAMCPPRVCLVCGKPSERIVARTGALDPSRPQAKRAMELAEAGGLTEEHFAAIRSFGITDAGKALVTQAGAGNNTGRVKALAAEAKAVLGGYFREFLIETPTTTGWTDCGHDSWRPGVVLDPFAGSGTTLAVATGHGRDAVGIDLDERNAHLARERVGMFLTVEHFDTEAVG
jgi:hypothetical protein